MNRLFIPNLNFEEELCGRSVNESIATIQARQEIAPLMGLLASPGDCVLVDEGAVPSQLPDCLNQVRFVTGAEVANDCVDLEVIPWGWTDSTRQLHTRYSKRGELVPTEEAVRSVNARPFMAPFDRVLSTEPELNESPKEQFGVLCTSEEEWKEAIGQFRDQDFCRWVAKPDISHAGRNRLMADGDQLNDQQRGWLRKQLKQTGHIYMEPWVRIVRECGLQYEVEAGSSSEDSTVEFLGAVELLNDSAGRYRGSSVVGLDTSDTFWQPAIQHGLAIVRHAAACGYVGPVGIDSMVFRNMKGQNMLRLVNDVNARLTMGRLSQQLRKLIKPDEYGIWCLGPALATHRANTSGISFMRELPDDVHIVETSPKSLAGRSVRLTSRLFIAQSSESYRSVCHAIRTGSAK